MQSVGIVIDYRLWRIKHRKLIFPVDFQLVTLTEAIRLIFTV